ncbi:MAG: BglII/BstYI family type II restriction endonuclease [Thermus sp.]|uniref:BglII/BstYI family type II restriction endonuclease n=1 Tax=Thermus sp. TaxID=275 RepID=UPI00391CB786
MRIAYDYSHLGGKEILQVRFPHILSDIQEVIAEVKAERSKISQEKGKQGKALYNPKKMNLAFRKAFATRGFRELKERYNIILPGQSQPVIKGAYKQIDFAKEGVLVEVQFGKYAFMFYDMAKFQYFFNESKADVGVEILPAHTLKKEMSSGVAYGEQLVYDIERLKRHFPAVPVYIILIDADV